MDLTFAQFVDLCASQARATAAPFTPSRLQSEVALRPAVDYLLGLGRVDAVAYLRGSFRGAGTLDVLAQHLYEQALPPLHVGQAVVCLTTVMYGVHGTVDHIDPEMCFSQHVRWVDEFGDEHWSRPLALMPL